MSDEFPVVIIGTGLAGYSLAREFRKQNKSTPVLMISQDDGHSYSKPMLSTGFTKGKDADGLSMADPGKMAEQLNVSIRTFTKVDAIDPSKKVLHIGSERLAYAKLVLATGASVNRLRFPGSDDAKVVSINDLMDYRDFRSQLSEGDHILIMGAGLIGCEYANDLLNGDYPVTVVDPSKTALNGLIPSPAGDAVIEGLSQAGATMLMNRFVETLERDGDKLNASLSDGSSITADIVISAIGLKPDLTLAESAQLKCNRGIITNRLLETSHDDVYALGDCAEVDGHVLLYVLPLMASARALAKTLNNEPTPVNYGVMPVATKTPACPVIVSPPLQQTGEWQFEQEGINIKGLYKKGDELLGFVLTGDRISEKQALSKELSGIHS